MRLIPFRPVVFIPPDTKIRFVSHYKLAIIETALLVFLTVGLLSTMGLNFGIDFRGGTLIEIRTADGPADIASIREKVGDLNFGETQIQQFGAPDDVMIRVAEQPGGEKAQQEVVTKVRAALGENVEVRRTEVVGATVSQELLQGSIIAVIIAFAGIFLYVWTRFEWQFSVAAILALLHDVAATICILSIFQIDFDLTVVAALLTLIGYAVNDTVVMFDRIRENLRKFKKMPLDQLIDKSLNDTLSRTFATAGCVLITLIALYVFGGEVIHGFMLTLLVGTAISSYTSLLVAAPFLYLLGVKRDWSGTATAPGRKPAMETPSETVAEAAAAAKSNPIAGADPELLEAETAAPAAAALEPGPQPRKAAAASAKGKAAQAAQAAKTPAAKQPASPKASTRAKKRGKR